MSDEIIQGSSEWHQMRLGKLTASRMADALAKTKSGYGASRGNLIATLIVERLTGQPTDTFTNAAMQWGTATEPQARDAYCFLYDAEVIQVPFIDHQTIAMSGASPDGLIGDDGMLEIKCPATATHIEFLLSGVIPQRYVIQMNWQMACSGRQWVDYLSYDPRLPSDLSMRVIRVMRDESEMKYLESAAVEFLSEVDRKLAQLQTLREAA